MIYEADSGAVRVRVNRDGRVKSNVAAWTTDDPPKQIALDVVNLVSAAERARLVESAPEWYRADLGKVLDSIAAEIAMEGPVPDSETERTPGFETLAPWPDPVDGLELLDEMASVFRSFVSLPPGADAALALWCLGAHCIDAFPIFPFVALQSPVRQCGKTRTMEVIACLAPRAWPVVDPSNAVLFRAIEAYCPTLLLDEADNVDFKKRSDLMALINGSHSRSTAWTPRCEGDDFELRNFSTWAPKVLAGIGVLPDTITSRAIVIHLERKPTETRLSRFRGDRSRAALAPLRQRAARWAADHAAELAEMDPALPAGLGDREADNWLPLVAIADVAGSWWATTARKVAMMLRGDPDEDQSAKVQLLGDVRQAFADAGTERLPTRELLEALTSREDRPWIEWKGGKPLSGRGLAQLLKPFGIHVGAHRMGEARHTEKGYQRADFAEAWRRYLPAVQGPDKPAPHPATWPFSEPVTDDVTDMLPQMLPHNPKRGADVTAVTDFSGGKGAAMESAA